MPRTTWGTNTQGGIDFINKGRVMQCHYWSVKGNNSNINIVDYFNM